jgi:hypothetical protein
MIAMPCLLILDGHTSRQCPAALELLQLFHVIVLIMPSHTSHVLQMFDIELAGPLKSYVYTFFKSIKRKCVLFEDVAGKVRYSAVMAILRAWDTSASIDHCQKSAKVAGLVPFDPELVLSGRLVQDDEIIARAFPQRLQILLLGNAAYSRRSNRISLLLLKMDLVFPRKNGITPTRYLRTHIKRELSGDRKSVV